MTSQCTAQLLADLGVTRSLSRRSGGYPHRYPGITSVFPDGSGDQGQRQDVLSMLDLRAPPWRHLGSESS